MIETADGHEEFEAFALHARYIAIEHLISATFTSAEKPNVLAEPGSSAKRASFGDYGPRAGLRSAIT
jgi:hypothetical protein